MEEKSLIDEDVVEEKSSAHKLIFPKSYRILKRRDYAHLFKNRRRLIGKFICIDYIIIPHKYTQMGITVSTRYGKSHERNRFKRCVREAYRLLYPELPNNLRMNVIPRYKAKFVKSTIIKDEMDQLLNCFDG